jgi:hypothetical protein
MYRRLNRVSCDALSVWERWQIQNFGLKTFSEDTILETLKLTGGRYLKGLYGNRLGNCVLH